MSEEKTPPPKYIGRWKIVSVLGEGAFGQVYAVHEIDDKEKVLRAMKVEHKQKNRNDEVLRMEIRVLEHVQGKFFTQLFDKGETDKFTYIVITLLGKPLDDIRRAQPNRHFSIVSSLKIGLQMVRAFKKLHFAGYIHRDVKPANMAPGYHNPHMVYLFDFGLSRYIFEKNEPGKLREPRRKVPFRGTYRYCSINAHKCLDQGRVDDIWGLLYSLVELCTGSLPWTGVKQVESLDLKIDTTDDELFTNCPRSFFKIKKRINQLKFKDDPEHNLLTHELYKNINAISSNCFTDPFEWQEHPEQNDPFSKHVKQNEEDEETVGTIESEYDSEYESGTGDSTVTTRTVDDTLDDLNEENIKEKAKQWEEQKKIKKQATATSRETKKNEKGAETKKGKKTETKSNEDSKYKKTVKGQNKPQSKPSKKDGKNQKVGKDLKSQVKFEGDTKGSPKK
ncbi:Protein kinase domain-containing protein [Meloidogyne graminicola]|uniref:Protein kinase domain-containing protein n=1 Tax=Meloidogyne graminicola TaxID=189291 RepID=A0A8S9ZZX5_9BILA|nr:Protein kinase domain-containing protein [Meloidogyne graminicola]